MATPYNISAKLTFQLNTQSLNSVVSQAKNALKDVKADIKIGIKTEDVENAKRLTQAVGNLSRALKGVTTDAGSAAAAFTRFNQAVAGFSSGGVQRMRADISAMGSAVTTTTKSVHESRDAFEQFGHAIGLSAKRFAAFTLAAGTMITLIGAIKNAYREAVHFDLQLNKLKQVSGDTAIEIRGISDEVQRLSTSLGASSKELIESAVTLKQAGIAGKDVKLALDSIAKASLAPNFSSQKQIVEGSIAAYQQFGKQIGNLREQLGAINAVAGDFATEASDLVTAVQKAGGTAAQTGTQFNELLAIFTSVRSTTRESADSISTGLRTIFTRIQRNDTVEALRSLGINLRYTAKEAQALGKINLEGQFVGGLEAVRRLSVGLGKLQSTDPRFAAAIEELGGYRQVSRVIPLISQMTETQKALNIARIGGASLDAAAEVRQEALANKFAHVREEFQKFINTITQSNGFQTLISFATTAASAFIKLSEVIAPLVPLIAGFSVARLATIGTTSLLSGITKRSTGGPVDGSGSGDSVHTMLEPGEFVVRKSVVQKVGRASLEYLNHNGALPKGYAKGGSVEGESEFPADKYQAALNKLRAKASNKRYASYNLGDDAESDFSERFMKAASSGKPIDDTSIQKMIDNSINKFRQQGKRKKGKLLSDADLDSLADREHTDYKPSQQNDTFEGKAVVDRRTNKGKQFLKDDKAYQQEEAYKRLYAEADEYVPHSTKSPAQLTSAVVTPPAPPKPPTPPVALTSPSPGDSGDPSRISFSSNNPNRPLSYPRSYGPLYDIQSITNVGGGNIVGPSGLSGDVASRIGNRIGYGPTYGVNDNYKNTPYGLVELPKYETPHAVRPIVGDKKSQQIFDVPPRRQKRSATPLPEGYGFAPDSPAERTKQTTIQGYNYSYGLKDAALLPEGSINPGYKDNVASGKLGRAGTYGFADITNQSLPLAPDGYRPPKARVIRATSVSGTELSTLSSEAIQKAGGANVLSQATQSDISTKTRIRVEKELTAGLERQLQALYPQISSTERLKKAQELAATALDSNAQLIKNKSGTIIGTSELDTHLNKKGIYTSAGLPEVSQPGFGSQFKSFLFGDKKSGRESLLKRSFSAENISTTIGVAAGISSTLGGILTPGSYNANDGLLEKSRGAAGSALTYGGIGAGAGLAFGPVAAGIGAAAGAIYGFTSGLIDATKQIREAKVSDAMVRFGQAIENAANNIVSAKSRLNSDLLKDIHIGNEAVSSKVDEQTKRSYFNPRRYISGAVYASGEEISNIRSKETRSVYGSNLGAIVTVLSRRAEELAKFNKDASAKDLAGGLGKDSVTGELVRVLALARKVPVAQVLEEFTETIKTAQIQIKTELEVNQARAAEERAAFSLTRLADAATNANASVARLESSLSSISGLASNAIGNHRITPFGDANFGSGANPLDRARANVIFSQAFGGNANSLVEHANAADTVSRFVPGLLESLGTTNLQQGESIGPRARKLLLENLVPGGTDKQKDDFLKNNKVVGDAVESIIGGLIKVDRDHEKEGGLKKALKDNSGQVSEEILKVFIGPIKEKWAVLAQELTKNADRFIEGLGNARQQLDRILEGQFKGSELTLSRQRFQADVQSERTGIPSSSLLSLAQLSEPYNARQRALASSLPGQEFDVDAIANRLGVVQGSLKAATKARDDAAGNKDLFPRLAANVEGLTNESNKLQAALRNLADPVARAAAFQEKLNTANENRNGRLDYAEKFYRADAQGKLRLLRSQQILQQVDSGKVKFGQLTQPEQGLFLDAVHDFGKVKLPSGRTGEGLRNIVLGGQPGVLDPNQEKERGGLQDQIGKVFAEAEKAQAALVQNQKSIFDTFITDLKATHNGFFARLATNLASENVNRLTNEKIKLVTQQDQLKTDEKQAGVLAKIGVKDNIGLKNLANVRGDINKYFEVDQSIKEVGKKNLSEIFNKDKLTEKFGRGNIDNITKFKDIFADELLHVSTNEQENIYAKFREGRYKVKPGDDPRKSANLLHLDLVTGLNDDVSKNIENRNSLRGRLHDRGVDNLEKLSDDEVKLLNQSFTNASLDVEGFAQKLKDVTKELEGVTVSLQTAKDNLAAAQKAEGQVAEAKADGGAIFRKRGTDTVPAMLTPGEFVVNARAAKKNASLLHHLNNGGNPEYLADGGIVGILNAKKELDKHYDWREEKRALLLKNSESPFITNKTERAIAERTRARDQNYIGNYLLGLQTRNDNQNVAYQQALVRGGADLPGEEGQIRAAVASVAGRRDFEAEAFNFHFGKNTYAQRFRQATSLPIPGFASGGLVDTVPAMLSPGEFVFSKRAVDNIGAGNVARIHHFANGGAVPGGDNSSSPNPLGFGFDGESKSILQSFNTAMSSFSGPATQLANSLEKWSSTAEKFPHDVNLTGNFSTNVTINGAEAFQGMEGKFRDMMVGYVTTEISRAFNRKLPDATK